MIINGNILRKAIRRLDITQQAAADKLKMSRQTLAGHFKSGELDAQLVQNVKANLGIDLHDVKLVEDGITKPKLATPMYNSAATAGDVEVYNDMNNDGPAFYVSIPQFRDCKFGKSVYGHSMYPTITSGCYVFCKPVPIKEHFIPGEIYYIEYDNFGVCKRLQKGPNPDEVLLVSDNDEMQADGTRRYESYVIKIDAIRQIFLVKGFFNQNHN